MQHILVISTDDALQKALPSFNRYFGWQREWTFGSTAKELVAAAFEIIVLHNAKPERLEGIRLLHSLRAKAAFCSVPVVFLSEPLSAPAQTLFLEEEFVSVAAIPFDAAGFSKSIDTAAAFRATHAKLLELRTGVTAAMGERRHADAKRQLESLSAIYTNPFVLARLGAELALAEGDYNGALTLARTALTLRDKSLAAHNLEGAALVKLGRVAEAKAALAKSSNLAQIHLENLIHWGDVYLDRGNVETSETIFKQALDLDGTQTKAREGLLAAQLIAGKIETSRQILDGAPGLDVARMCNLRAIGLVAQSQFSAAERLYKNSIKFLSDDASAYLLWFNLGLCLKKAGRLKDAHEYFTIAKRGAPAGFTRAEEQLRHIEGVLDLAAAG